MKANDQEPHVELVDTQAWLHDPDPMTGEVAQGMGTGPWYEADKGHFWICECGTREYIMVYRCSACWRDNVYARANG
jgi:hypothetical protein